MEVRILKSVVYKYNKVEVEIGGVQPNEVKTARDVLDSLILDETNKLKAFVEEHIPADEPKQYNKPSYPPKKEWNNNTGTAKPQGQVSEKQVALLKKNGYNDVTIGQMTSKQASDIISDIFNPRGVAPQPSGKVNQEQFNQQAVNKAPSGFDL